MGLHGELIQGMIDEGLGTVGWELSEKRSGKFVIVLFGWTLSAHFECCFR